MTQASASAPDFMLRATYQEGWDYHPNLFANQTIGPLFADSIVEAVCAYRAGLTQEGQEP
jgi:hypothetical protein